MCDMGQERCHMENVLSQRFNFMLVLFSLVIAGAINVIIQQQLIFIMWTGFTLIFLISLSIYRCQWKFDLIFERLDPTHPAKVIDALVTSKLSARQLIGYWVPTICWAILFTGALLSTFGVITVT